jgi:hypothetical protein
LSRTTSLADMLKRRRSRHSRPLRSRPCAGHPKLAVETANALVDRINVEFGKLGKWSTSKPLGIGYLQQRRTKLRPSEYSLPRRASVHDPKISGNSDCQCPQLRRTAIALRVPGRKCSPFCLIPIALPKTWTGLNQGTKPCHVEKSARTVAFDRTLTSLGTALSQPRHSSE